MTVGGAGGKGVWGKPGQELEATGTCDDIRDPNYDSDSQVLILRLFWCTHLFFLFPDE